LVKEGIIKKMREKGLKLTAQRLAILDVLLEKAPLHPGAGLVYREVRKKMKGVSLSTVYSTLKELSKQGILKTLEFDQMENRYEGNILDHINLICRGCKKIMDYREPISIDSKKIEKRTRFRVTDTRLDYYGFCQECRKKGISGPTND
jgi:Fe2+ or Zn2+ uptake regulation protein